ncbi:MAG: hypothetical protein ACM3N4_04360 [Nitrososphaerota archaeon]
MAEPLLTITSTNDGVELVLTDTTVSMKLSDTILQQAQREMRQDLQNDRDVQKGGLAARFARFVTTAVDGLLHHTIEYSIQDIASVAYQDGGLVFTYSKKQVFSFEAVNIDGTPALKSFAEADARAFVQCFADVKARQR